MQIEIDVVSDVVCPWCFIGKHHLGMALEDIKKEFPPADISVRWHPFQLNPETPEQGDAYFPYLEEKFGGAEQVRRIWDRVRQAGAHAGIHFEFERISIRPNTLRAHCLILRAQQEGTADILVERLFVSHFQEGDDIGNPETLAKLAAEAGIPERTAWEVIESEHDKRVVLQEIEQAQALGIQGVPFFIINRRVGISGAQPPGALAKAIRETVT